MDLRYFKSENRLELYKKHNHIPSIEIKKYSFDQIDLEFDKLEKRTYSDTKIRIHYIQYIPQVANCAVLNCANADKPNAGYKIDHCIAQEGQLFYDSDIFTADLKDLYRFDFSNELLYAKNVTFHTVIDYQWEDSCIRKNDMIIAASKRLKHSGETKRLESALERIIDSIFKVSLIHKTSTLLLWQLDAEFFEMMRKL